MSIQSVRQQRFATICDVCSSKWASSQSSLKRWSVHVGTRSCSRRRSKALVRGASNPKLDRACSKLHRRQTSAGAPCCGWRGATESCHERCATLPHERGGMPVGSRAVRTVLSWSDTCDRRLLAIARTPTGGHGRTSRNMEQRPVRNASPTRGLFGASRNPRSNGELLYWWAKAPGDFHDF
jgi:hypothetical protein